MDRGARAGGAGGLTPVLWDHAGLGRRTQERRGWIEAAEVGRLRHSLPATPMPAWPVTVTRASAVAGAPATGGPGGTGGASAPQPARSAGSSNSAIDGLLRRRIERSCWRLGRRARRSPPLTHSQGPARPGPPSRSGEGLVIPSRRTTRSRAANGAGAPRAHSKPGTPGDPHASAGPCAHGGPRAHASRLRQAAICSRTRAGAVPP